jgi:hypothetical protein
VHDAHAAHARAVRQPDELAQRLAGFVRAQAVQVQLALNAPVAATQLAGHVETDAGAAKAQLIVHVQQGADIELVAHGFAQHVLFVQHHLQRQRGCRLQKADFVARAQRRDLADAERKQIAFTLARCTRLGLREGQGFGLFAHLLEMAGDAGQILQRAVCVAHSRPSSAMEQAAPGPTMMWSSTRTSIKASGLECGQRAVGTAGLHAAAGVVVREDHRAGLMVQGAQHDFTRVDGGLRQGTAKHFFKSQQAVLAVQKQHGKHLVRPGRQMQLQIVLDGFGEEKTSRSRSCCAVARRASSSTAISSARLAGPRPLTAVKAW